MDSSKKQELGNLDRIALRKALKETPTLKVGGPVPKSMNKGFSDTPLFSNSEQKKIW